MARKPGLGKGLGALIPENQNAEAPAPAEAAAGPLRTVTLTSIRPNPYQPRRSFTDESLESLAASVKEIGVLQPLIVRPVEGAPETFELIAGERRWRAATMAGLESIPVLVQDEVNDRLSLEQAVVENLHRIDLIAAGGGRRLPAAHQRVRPDPRAGRPARRQEPSKYYEHVTTAPAGRGGPGGAGRRADHGRPRPLAAGHRRPRGAGDHGRARHQERPVGPRDRGGGQGVPRAPAGAAGLGRAASRSRGRRACARCPTPAWPSSSSSSRTTWTPGSTWTSRAATAGSSSTSPTSTTSSGSTSPVTKRRNPQPSTLTLWLKLSPSCG